MWGMLFYMTCIKHFSSLFSPFSIKKILWHPASTSTKHKNVGRTEVALKEYMPKPTKYQKQKKLISSLYINLGGQPSVVWMWESLFLHVSLSEKERKRGKWGGSTQRGGVVQEGSSRDGQGRPWPPFLFLQLFIFSWYLALSLACCGSPITLTTRLSHITQPTTLSWYSWCCPSCWYSSWLHILPAEGS